MSAEKPNPDLAFTKAGEPPRPIEVPPIAPPRVALVFAVSLFLQFAGAGLLGWYAFVFDTRASVWEPFTTRYVVVHDLGRVSDRLVGMIGGGVLLLLGTMVALRPARTARPRPDR